MIRNYTSIGLFAAAALVACSSAAQTSPYYNSTTAAGTYASSQNNEGCERKETNRQLLGGALGGTVGAFAGKELLGGTKGVVAGAALGGALGYGVGDISVDCSPAPTTPTNTAYQSAPATTTYQGASSSPYQQQGTSTYGATPAGFQRVSCPAGTSAQANGTCLMDDSSGLQANTISSSPTTTSPYQQYVAPAPIYQAAPAPVARTSPYRQYVAPSTTSGNVVTANTSIAPSPWAGTEVTRQLGDSNYRVKSGDTVYSLSRSLCVPLSEIQGANGLNSSYGIKIGQGLNLPASRC